jgi:hypothetical protein
MTKNDWVDIIRKSPDDDLDDLIDNMVKSNELTRDLGSRLADTLKVVRLALKKYFPKQFDFSVIKRSVNAQEILIEIEMVEVPKGFDTNSEIGRFNVMNMSKVFNEVYKYIGWNEQYRVEYTIKEKKPIIMVKMILR